MSQPSLLPPVENWLASNLELIAFLENPALALEQHWWSELIGTDPDESTRKRNERSETGEYGGFGLQLTIDPLRARWVAMPSVEVSLGDGFPGPPSIGPLPQAIEKFAPLMEQWLDEARPAIVRLAFAARLLEVTNNREEAYQLLDRYLSSVDVDPQTTDFQYRINRKRTSQSGIPNLIINRLCTWGAVRVEFGMRVSVPGTENSKDVKQIYNGCMLSLDVNTDPDFKGPLPHDHLTALWRELVELGREIAALGDVA
jgi:hypothetical protein